MTKTPHPYFSPPSDYQPDARDAQILASFVVRHEMALHGDEEHGISPHEDLRETIEWAAREEVLDDLKPDAPADERWLAFQLEKMVRQQEAGENLKIPFSDEESRDAHAIALMDYLNTQLYDLSRNNAFLTFDEWDDHDREYFQKFQALLETTKKEHKNLPNDFARNVNTVSSGYLPPLPREEESMPNLNPPPVKDAKVGKGSMRPNSSSDMKELRDALPPGVSPGQSGYGSRYKG